MIKVISDDILEVHDSSNDIVKTKSKEDISTLNKNLKEGTPEGKVGKKKKFKQDKIENDLYENESGKGKSKKKAKSTKPINTESFELQGT